MPDTLPWISDDCLCVLAASLKAATLRCLAAGGELLHF